MSSNEGVEMELTEVGVVEGEKRRIQIELGFDFAYFLKREGPINLMSGGKGEGSRVGAE
jgi:hypothetical protein